MSIPCKGEFCKMNFPQETKMKICPKSCGFCWATYSFDTRMSRVAAITWPLHLCLTDLINSWLVTLFIPFQGSNAWPTFENWISKNGVCTEIKKVVCCLQSNSARQKMPCFRHASKDVTYVTAVSSDFSETEKLLRTPVPVFTNLTNACIVHPLPSTWRIIQNWKSRCL